MQDYSSTIFNPRAINFAGGSAQSNWKFELTKGMGEERVKFEIKNQGDTVFARGFLKKSGEGAEIGIVGTPANLVTLSGMMSYRSSNGVNFTEATVVHSLALTDADFRRFTGCLFYCQFVGLIDEPVGLKDTLKLSQPKTTPENQSTSAAGGGSNE